MYTPYELSKQLTMSKTKIVLASPDALETVKEGIKLSKSKSYFFSDQINQ